VGIGAQAKRSHGKASLKAWPANGARESLVLGPRSMQARGRGADSEAAAALADARWEAAEALSSCRQAWGAAHLLAALIEALGTSRKREERLAEHLARVRNLMPKHAGPTLFCFFWSR
jgi:hypothetical protein